MDNETLWAKWQPLAQALKSEKIDDAKIPVHIAVQEAHLYADTGRQLYDPPAEGEEGRPYLRAVQFRLPRTVLDEIKELAELVAQVQSQVMLGKAANKEARAKLERAWMVLEYLEEDIEFLLDDDLQEPADDQLASLKAQEKELGESAAALAQLLQAFALLARDLEERLRQDETFEPGWISEAEELAAFLRTTPPRNPAEASPEIELRNRLRILLFQRITRLRKAVNHVFKHHPEIRRKFNSAYERHRRARYRANQQPVQPVTGNPPAAPGNTPVTPGNTPAAPGPTPAPTSGSTPQSGSTPVAGG